MENKSYIGSRFLLSCPFLKQFVNAKLWRRKRQPTPIFLPGESHGQRSLAGYSLWGRKESDTTEATSLMQNWLNFIQLLCVKITLGLKGNYLDNLH